MVHLPHTTASILYVKNTVLIVLCLLKLLKCLKPHLHNFSTPKPCVLLTVFVWLCARENSCKCSYRMLKKKQCILCRGHKRRLIAVLYLFVLPNETNSHPPIMQPHTFSALESAYLSVFVVNISHTPMFE